VVTGGVNGAVTVTVAVSVAVTSGPLGGVPVSVATLVRFDVRLGERHVYVALAPGAITARPAIVELVTEQAGERASVTKTFDRGTSPVFVTTIVNVAVDP